MQPLSPTRQPSRIPVAGANPLSNTADIVAVLHGIGFVLSPAEGRRPVDEQTDCLLIGTLWQLAACFGNPTPDQNKGRLQLG